MTPDLKNKIAEATFMIYHFTRYKYQIPTEDTSGWRGCIDRVLYAILLNGGSITYWADSGQPFMGAGTTWTDVMSQMYGYTLDDNTNYSSTELKTSLGMEAMNNPAVVAETGDAEDELFNTGSHGMDGEARHCIVYGLLNCNIGARMQKSLETEIEYFYDLPSGKFLKSGEIPGGSSSASSDSSSSSESSSSSSSSTTSSSSSSGSATNTSSGSTTSSSNPSIPVGTLEFPLQGVNTYVSTYFGGTLHQGTAFATSNLGETIAEVGGNISGYPIVSAESGTVISVKHNDQYLGMCVKIQDDSGTVITYGYCSSLEENIVAGATVVLGQQIGTVGDTGLTTGPQLYFAVETNNTPVDPETLTYIGRE
jgi:murein DD-endopeptidase MepM/ murein hydrolase activator NlpD